MDFIAIPLSYLLKFLYDTIAFQNYGLTIIFFTLIVKIIMLPLTIKQTKSTAKQQELQPEIAKLQKRYKNDKEKLNQEMMKFYKENSFNPASGCLPLLVQFPILISLYWVVIEPIKFLIGYKAMNREDQTYLDQFRFLIRKMTGRSIDGFREDINAMSNLQKNPELFNTAEGLNYQKSYFIDRNGNYILRNIEKDVDNGIDVAVHDSIAALDREPIFRTSLFRDASGPEEVQGFTNKMYELGVQDKFDSQDAFYATGKVEYDFVNNMIVDKSSSEVSIPLYKASETMLAGDISPKDILISEKVLVSPTGDIVDASGEVMYHAQESIVSKGNLYFFDGRAGNAKKSILIDKIGNVITSKIPIEDGTPLLQKAQIINFKFLGLDLGQIPKYQPKFLFGDDWQIYLPLFILVVLAVTITYFSSKMAMPKEDPNKKKQHTKKPGPAGSMGKSMQYFGPIMTLLIAFSMPASAVLYWTVSSLFQWGQQIYINKFVKGKVKGAKA